MFNYDLYYFPEKGYLTKKYDFITCTEVVEHFRKPLDEFKLFDKILKIKGVLAI